MKHQPIKAPHMEEVDKYRFYDAVGWYNVNDMLYVGNEPPRIVFKNSNMEDLGYIDSNRYFVKKDLLDNVSTISED